ncbi:MAG: O-antigen ligase family protein [Deltaproteobacteria bacterium]|nr:O-antigen ligase family protein [Deltaproteobacteria bacterium]
MKWLGGVPAPPILFVLALGIFGIGGDAPPATFLIRATVFVAFLHLLFRSESFRLRINAVDALLLALWLLGGLSLARGGYRWISYQWFLHHTAALLLYLLARAELSRGDSLPRAAALLVLGSAAAQMVIVGFQRVALGNTRPPGSLANPNFLAEFLVYAIAVAWAWSVAETGRAGKAARRWPLLVIPLALAGIYLTQSRGGLVLAFLVGGVLMADRFGWKKAAGIAAVLIALVVVVPNPFRGRFLGEGDPFAYERLAMWKAAWRIFAENPWGVGVGHFKYYWQVFRDPVAGSIVRYAKYAQTPHDEFLSLLSELGIPGAAGFLGLAAVGLVSLRRAFEKREPASLGAALVLLVSFLHSFIEYNYHILGLLLLNAVALAIVSERLWPAVHEREIRPGKLVKGAAALFLLAMAAYSGMTLGGTVLEGFGLRAFQEGRMEKAARWFVRATAADPWRATYPDDASAAEYRLFEEGAGEGRLFHALELEQEANLRNPLDYRYLARLGFLFSKVVEHVSPPARGAVVSASLRCYDRAIEWNPHGADLRYLKAVVLKMAGRPDMARPVVEAILADEPRYVPGWVLLAELREREDPAGALAAYEKALAIHREYKDRATESYEKEFLALDDKMVTARIDSLRSRLRK